MDYSSDFEEATLNFRKLRQEFSPAVLKEGKRLAGIKESCVARLVACTDNSYVIEATILGSFSDIHRCQLEIDRHTSTIVLSHCDCPSHVDCHHLASLLFFLEEQFHHLLLAFHDENQMKDSKLQEAKKRSEKKIEAEREKTAVKEFVEVAHVLSNASLFTKRAEAIKEVDLFINIGSFQAGPRKMTELSFAVKLPEKTKPVAILQPKLFFQSLVLEDPLFLGTTMAVLSLQSFGEGALPLMESLCHTLEFVDRTEKAGKAAFVESDFIDHLFIEATRLNQLKNGRITLYSDNFEKPYILQKEVLYPECSLSLIQEPSPRVVMKAKLEIKGESVPIRDVHLIRGASLGCIKGDEVFLLPHSLEPRAKEELEALDTVVIPPELYGSFFTYSLPELMKKSHITMSDEVKLLAKAHYEKVIPSFKLKLDVVDGKLLASPSFIYCDVELPETKSCRSRSDMNVPYVYQDCLKKQEGVGETPSSLSCLGIARDIAYEAAAVQSFLWGFTFDTKTGDYSATAERKISEFFTETLVSKRKSCEIELGASLMPYVSMEETSMQVSITYKEAGVARCSLELEGPLKGIPLSRLLEANRLKKAAVEVDVPPTSLGWTKRYICLGAERIEQLALSVEELSFPQLSACSWDIPLWLALGVDERQLSHAGISVILDTQISELRQRLVNPALSGQKTICLAEGITVKGYQKEGIEWLSQLSSYGLSGILADDMGLGKSMQTIALLAEHHLKNKNCSPSFIVCPTSLVENWIQEIRKFQPLLSTTALTGTPSDRKKLLEKTGSTHIFIASYSLVQKDVDLLSQVVFSYLVLDEGQSIKNRETVTARSVKSLKSSHRLILTGTPIENSLDDLWSLFDFLMPGYVGTYDRFIRQYIKTKEPTKTIEQLKRRVQPFILRRMKQDVLKDLPPITHSVIHCTLSEEQHQLYKKMANQAREELEKIVGEEGFEKAKMHVLATLTRLKQICCHPRLIQADMDCSKFELLFQILHNIIVTKKKAVIFSQYAKMLGLMKQQLENHGYQSVLLDGATKNRLSLVEKFNSDSSIPFFLVSLRAGGNGLNLVGADTVILYDIWWNPAVENQATDRVWRMGQKENVHCYKLITKGTIEEKIVELQEKKKDLITNVVDSEEDMLSRLSWADVLELLGEASSK